MHCSLPPLFMCLYMSEVTITPQFLNVQQSYILQLFARFLSLSCYGSLRKTGIHYFLTRRSKLAS